MTRRMTGDRYRQAPRIWKQERDEPEAPPGSPRGLDPAAAGGRLLVSTIWISHQELPQMRKAMNGNAGQAPVRVRVHSGCAHNDDFPSAWANEASVTTPPGDSVRGKGRSLF
jgi:hypothetical protein